ncbi:lactococcin 972 family bacteriocin [Lysinibacillus sphaericus]|uniref:lactococcin 972 family bacteriocin n=1 Tax=Lysinibacillus sphaericus TaxID=1421 RepID=UPI001E5545AC|nr:lactococcin 972 family bacteriocin [Lysinibacillus sphaericus]MCS1382011.1 lactococcin 972 family bacteriocin [Lysinibacillus sphaericus]
MLAKKTVRVKIVVLALMALLLLPSGVLAVSHKAIQEPLIATTSMVATQSDQFNRGDISRKWLAPGPITQYPHEGGTWEYGFWDVKVRSYYTVDRCHGSTVELNGNRSRSADTAAGQKSIAELWAVQYPTHVDRYYYRVCD